MRRFGNLTASTVTGALGSPELKLEIPRPEGGIADDELPEAIARLGRRDVEDLHDFLGEWLR